ncbi:hypothetical protein SAMN04487970_102443 [Paenibacillus tianmuensis]|uniref:Uncharacterized protein n=1 Tax=Paenibacillus tianmuensis TaxID=624147 RepID=A0A1G4S7A8_9BACL|nr:hypothetical protein SAMN04487970_102443 [Paenibacillus tianmuensis]
MYIFGKSLDLPWFQYNISCNILQGQGTKKRPVRPRLFYPFLHPKTLDGQDKTIYFLTELYYPGIDKTSFFLHKQAKLHLHSLQMSSQFRFFHFSDPILTM